MDQENPNSFLEAPLIVQRSRGGYDHVFVGEPLVELKHQLKLAGPLCLVSFLQYSLEIISVMFVGRLGELSLSVASMATSFASVTGFSFMVLHFSSSLLLKLNNLSLIIGGF